MEAAIKELRVMVGVILALMVMLLLAVVALLLRHTSTRAFKAALPVFFRSKDEGRASIEKRPPPPTKVPNENRNSTVVRIADYQVTFSSSVLTPHTLYYNMTNGSSLSYFCVRLIY